MTPDLLPLTAALAASAAFAGLLAGLLGVGGGIVLVPVLVWVLQATGFPPAITMHMAVATSLATIVFTSVSSARAHDRRGAVDRRVLLLWGPGIVAGAFAGGLAARAIDPGGLKTVFGIVALLIAANLATPRIFVLAPDLPASRAPNWAMGGIIGVFSALMGIGGGAMSVPLLTAFSIDIRRAVGTAATFGFVIAVPATVGFMISGWSVPDRPPLSLGYVNLIAVAVILPFSTAAAPLGAKLAHWANPVWIRRLFSGFLIVTAIRMLTSAWS